MAMYIRSGTKSSSVPVPRPLSTSLRCARRSSRGRLGDAAADRVGIVQFLATGVDQIDQLLQLLSR